MAASLSARIRSTAASAGGSPRKAQRSRSRRRAVPDDPIEIGSRRDGPDPRDGEPPGDSLVGLPIDDLFQGREPAGHALSRRPARRPPGRRLLDDQRSLPSRAKGRRREVDPHDRRIGGQRGCTSSTTSAAAMSRRRTAVSACQRASRSRVKVATRPRCSIDSSPGASPIAPASRPRATTAASVNRAKPVRPPRRPPSPSAADGRG